MKLLFLIESMSSQSGGPAIEIARLATLLSNEEDISITIASITPKNESLLLDEKVFFFQFKKPLFLRISWFRAIQDLRELIERHDIIFSTGIWGPIDGFALRLAWQENKPVYIRVCGMLEPYILARNPLKKRLGRFLYLNENLKQAKGIIVNSNSEANNLRSIGLPNEKILVIPNGIDLMAVPKEKKVWKEYFGVDSVTPVLLYLGRLHPKKGLHFLLEAISYLPEENRKFILLVAGEYCDDNYRIQIQTMVNSLGLNNIIKFSGFVSGEEKERHFYAADCFILPSESEGLPNSVLEAMAHGLPVIITNGCNIPEVADYNAGLVIDLSISNLTKAIEWFLSLNLLSKIISKNAKRLIIEKFSLEVSLSQYKELIKVLAKH